MNSKKRCIIMMTVPMLILLSACSFFGNASNRVEPEGGESTAEYQYAIIGNQLIAEKDGVEVVIFQGDRNGAILNATLAPHKIYLLCDDMLYSMNADGSELFEIATKCYNPKDLLVDAVSFSASKELGTVRYYDGFVYFIKYGTTSELRRFQCGGNSIETLAKNKVSAFYISEDGILYGFDSPDNFGNRENTIEIQLN